MILPHGNEKDKYFIVQEHLPKRKKDEKRNHVLKINLKFPLKEPELVGNFSGNLTAIYRIKKSRYLFGFVIDADMRGTNVYRLDLLDEGNFMPIDLFKSGTKQAVDMKIKLIGLVTNFGIGRIVNNDNMLHVVSFLN